MDTIYTYLFLKGSGVFRAKGLVARVLPSESGTESGTLHPDTPDTLGIKTGFRQLHRLAWGNPGSKYPTV